MERHKYQKHTHKDICKVLAYAEKPYLQSLSSATPKSYSDISTHLWPQTCDNNKHEVNQSITSMNIKD